MKIKFLILFFVFPLFLFAQTKISGRVFDKDTHKPVSNVVIYTNAGNKITMTDDDGQYNLIVNQSEPVYFKQLGYDFFTGLSDSLLLNPDVYLSRNIVNLNEVVISPENAQTLLNKAIQNLFARHQKNKTKYHLCHIEETTDTGGYREAYVSIESVLSNVNSKKRKLDWNINLVQLDRKTILEDSFRPKKSRVVRIAFFPEEMNIISESNDYIYESYEDDNDQLIIKVSPKRLDKKHYRYDLYTIDKQDTILTDYIGQSFPNSSEITTQKFLSLTRQTLNHFSRLKFVQDELLDSYYLKELQHTGAVKMSMNDFACVHSYKISSKEILINPTHSTTKIKPFTYVLFENDFPNSPDFWKQFVK